MSANHRLQFVDTNILVYAHDVTAGDRHHAARQLLEELWATNLGCLSLQVLQEFFVVVTRKTKHPLPAATAKEIIQLLTAWRIHEPVVRDVLAAIDLQQRYGCSFWDALILTSAQQLGCEIVWSEDLNPGQQYSGVTVASPFTSSLQQD